VLCEESVGQFVVGDRSGCERQADSPRHLLVLPSPFKRLGLLMRAHDT
jgi:hypothetical protein